MNHLTKQIGQATIETLCAASLVALLLTASTTIAYLFYARQVADFSMQEGLLCLETRDKLLSTCKKTLQSQIKNLLFFHSITSVSLQRKSEKNRADLHLVFLSNHHHWSKELFKKRTRL